MKTSITLIASAFLATGMSVTAQNTRSFGDGSMPDFLKPFADTGATTLTSEQGEAVRKHLAGNPQMDLTNLALDKWDLDGDGKLSLLEIENARKAIRTVIADIRKVRFDNADADKDGYLSLKEFTDSAPPDKKDQCILNFALLDINKDLKLSFGEFVEGCPKPYTPPQLPLWAKLSFDAVDTDKDGIISFDEFTALLTPPTPPQIQPQGGQQRPIFFPADIAAMFANLDANGDNGLTLDEWLGTRLPPPPLPLADFATADKNANGSVDPLEFGMVARASHINCILSLKLFRDADLNRDHLLDATEYATIKLPPPPVVTP